MRGIVRRRGSVDAHPAASMVTAPGDLGSRLRELRQRRGLTLHDIASRADVSPTHLSELERGKSSPTIGAVVRLARALEVDVRDLLDAVPRTAARAEHVTVVGEGPRARVQLVSAGVRGGHLQVVQIRIVDEEPVTFSDVTELMVWVRTGRLLYEGVDVVRLGAGDLLHAVGEVSHQLTSRSTEPAVARLVMTRRSPTSQ